MKENRKKSTTPELLMTPDALTKFITVVASKTAERSGLYGDTMKFFTDMNLQLPRNGRGSGSNDVIVPSQRLVEKLVNHLSWLQYYDRWEILDELHELHKDFVEKLIGELTDFIKDYKSEDPTFRVQPVGLLTLGLMEHFKSELPKTEHFEFKGEEKEEREGSTEYSLNEKLINNIFGSNLPQKEELITLISPAKKWFFYPEELSNLEKIGFVPAPIEYIAGLLLQYPNAQDDWGKIKTVHKINLPEKEDIFSRETKGRVRKIGKKGFIFEDFAYNEEQSSSYEVFLNEGKLSFGYIPPDEGGTKKHAFIRLQFPKKEVKK